MLRVINGQSVGSRGEVERGKAFRTLEGKEGQEQQEGERRRMEEERIFTLYLERKRAVNE